MQFFHVRPCYSFGVYVVFAASGFNQYQIPIVPAIVLPDELVDLQVVICAALVCTVMFVNTWSCFEICGVPYVEIFDIHIFANNLVEMCIFVAGGSPRHFCLLYIYASKKIQENNKHVKLKSKRI